ncbi:hypothetical protein M4I74_13540, partial [Enterococcus faecium]|uniref:hypothetical protein n=1 Tax=Enterococcus faecium TaxID=1352 RepID=UPI002543BD47
KDNRNSIRKEVLHLIKFVKKTVAIPDAIQMSIGSVCHLFLVKFFDTFLWLDHLNVSSKERP